MADAFSTLLQLLLTVLGVASTPDASALGLAIAVLALTALTLTVAVLVPDAAEAGAPHPRRAIDASVLLSQSDPDAAGHPRPRAPGVVPAA